MWHPWWGPSSSGAQIVIDRARWQYLVRVAAQKATKWSGQLRACVAKNALPAGQAAKLAGKVSFALTVAADRCGRACVKYVHRQAHCPLSSARMSPGLTTARLWFAAYLDGATEVRRQPQGHFHTRRVVHIWSDAAGASRWLAFMAVSDGEWRCSRIRTPDWLWSQLLPRGDEQIGLQ